MPEQLLW